MSKENGAQGDQGAGGSGDQKIRVGEKDYTAADVQNLLSSAKASTEKSQQVSRILDVCAKYEMEPEEFAQQAVGGFTVISELINEGIIDAQGNILKKDVKEKNEKKSDNLDSLFNLDDMKDSPKSADKIAAIVNKALEAPMGELKKGFDDLRDIQTSMIRSNYQKEIIGKFPNLDAEDVSKIFAISMGDRTKNLWDVAKKASEAKAIRQAEVEKAFAKKHGLDYDEMLKRAGEQDENNLKEKDSKGGAASLAEGKKISFRPKGRFGDKADKVIDPLELTKEYFLKVDNGG